MTAFIRQERLLEADEIEAIIVAAPLDLIAFQQVAATLPLAERATMESWLESFHRAAAPIGTCADPVRFAEPASF